MQISASPLTCIKKETVPAMPAAALDSGAEDDESGVPGV